MCTVAGYRRIRKFRAYLLDVLECDKEITSNNYLLTLTYLLTYLLTQSLTHPPTHSLTHSLTHLVTYLLTYLLTYSMEKSPSWAANWFAASQEIPRILWNPKVHYRIHKCPPPVLIMSQLEIVHNPKSHSLKIPLNVILPSTPGSPQWSLLLKFPHQTLYKSLLSPIRATCPAHLSLSIIIRTVLGEEYRSLSSSLCSFLQSPLPRPS